MKLSKNYFGKATIIEIIQKFFDKEFIETTAKLTKFIQRQRKIGCLNFFFLCVFIARREDTISLEDLCRELQKEGIEIRKQSLQNRFSASAADFMKKMVEHALSDKLGLRGKKIECGFDRIVINDSTVFQLPDEYADRYKGYGGEASVAGIKHQYCYDLLNQEILDITVQRATEADVNYPLQDLRKNDLRIEDLGYFKVEKFRAIEKAEAYFLSRLKFGITIYISRNGIFKKLDLLKIIDKMQEGEIRSIEIYLGEKEKFPCRLVLEKVPKQIANEKRRKLKTDKQNKRKSISKQRLIFCDVNAFVTNSSIERLPDNLLRQCYSLRWQIEIMFKSWKSYFKIDKVRKMKIERFECINYGCLMLIIISTNLFRYFKQWYLHKCRDELSELKFFKFIVSIKTEFYEVVKNQQYLIADFLDYITAIIERTCIKEQKKNKLKPLNIITLIS